MWIVDRNSEFHLSYSQFREYFYKYYGCYNETFIDIDWNNYFKAVYKDLSDDKIRENIPHYVRYFLRRRDGN